MKKSGKYPRWQMCVFGQKEGEWRGGVSKNDRRLTSMLLNTRTRSIIKTRGYLKDVTKITWFWGDQ